MIFPIDLAQFHKLEVNNWHSKKNQLSKFILDENYKRNQTENDLAMFNSDRGNGNYVDSFIDIFNEELQNFCQEIKRGIQVIDAWSVSYDKGDYHSVHTHGTANFSGVLYYQFDPKIHTGTNFVTEQINPLTNSTIIHSPPAEEGIMYIFPASMMHFTTPNNSTIQRKIISFDILTDKVVR